METQETICRLCLKICVSFNALEGNTKNFLEKLLLKINLTAVQKPVVCTNCEDILEKCFDFKAMCINVRGNIVPFVNRKDAIKLDVVDVPLSGNEKGNGVPEDQDICIFCRRPIGNCSTITSHVENGDVLLKKMIIQCLPELNLSITKKPVSCSSCRGSLEVYFHFLTNCLMVEEKIKKYCESLHINSIDQIELSNLLQFTLRNVTALEVDGNLVDIIKIEKFCEETEDEREIGMGYDIKLEHMSYDDGGDVKVEIEHETKSYMEMTDLKFNNEEEFTQRNMLECKEESDNLFEIKTEQMFCEENEIKKETLVEMEEQTFLFNEGIEIKTDESDFSRFEGGVVSSYAKVTTETEITMYECASCSYQTKFKVNLKKHLLVHNNPSEVTIYKCESCSHQTKSRDSFIRHLLVHRNPSEITMYKCDSCSFESKHKRSLNEHSLRHKDPSEVTKYKCDSCSFQSRYRWILKEHSLIHAPQATMYKCDSCPFQTNRTRYLRKHSLRLHKDPSEVTMYKCASCSHQTKSKENLTRHLLVHRNLSEVTVYKCDYCSFQTNTIRYLKRHLLVHKDPSEVTMYKCNSCSFQSRYKRILKEHSLVHAPQATVYKCDSCPFQTKRKCYLRKHFSRLHKDPSEVKMHKCDSCSYQTKYKEDLSRHLLVHMDPSEVTMYKCDSCPYRTKRKGDLKSHILRVHKNSSEITT